MIRIFRPVLAVGMAGLVAAALAGCTTSGSAATNRPTAVHTSSASSSATRADHVFLTCTLADLFYSKLQNADDVKDIAGSGPEMYAQNVGLALIDDNQLDAALTQGKTAFDADLSALRAAVLGGSDTAPKLDLPAGVMQPPFDANDPKITLAITKLGNDCKAAGYSWGTDELGG